MSLYILLLQKVKAEKAEPTPQDRLEKVWATLKMPDGQKLDMAIKYSSDTYHAKLEEVGTSSHQVQLWQGAKYL